MERETGFEPATSTLARSHSTTELFPLAGTPKLPRSYRPAKAGRYIRPRNATVGAGTMRTCLMLAIAFAAVSVRPAAQAQTDPAFDVATVKPAGLDGPFAQGRWIRMESANRFVAHNHALRTLVAAAYDLAPEAIAGGPPWV